MVPIQDWPELHNLHINEHRYHQGGDINSTKSEGTTSISSLFNFKMWKCIFLDLSCLTPCGAELKELATNSEIVCVREHGNFSLKPDMSTLVAAPWASGTTECKVAQVICNARYFYPSKIRIIHDIVFHLISTTPYSKMLAS